MFSILKSYHKKLSVLTWTFVDITKIFLKTVLWYGFLLKTCYVFHTAHYETNISFT